MSVPTEAAYIVEFVSRLVRDTTYSKWDDDEMYNQLMLYEETIAGEAVWWPNGQLKTSYRPSTFVYPKVGFLASDATINTARDGTGTAVTADTADYRNGVFRFTAKQTYDYLFVHGKAFNPFYAAADLIESHPTAEDISNLKSYSVFNYRIQFAHDVPYSRQLRRQGALLNQKREARLVEPLSVTLIDDILTNEYGIIWP